MGDEIDSGFEARAMAIKTGPYQIVAGDRLCQPMSELLVMTSAIGHGAYVVQNGTRLVDPKASFEFPCQQLPFAVLGPFHGPLEAALRNDPVANMTLEITPRQAPGNGGRGGETGFLLRNAVCPTFANFYERQAEWLLANVDGDPNKWPMLFRFCRVARNAVIHFGRITITNPKAEPVTWEKLSYSPADNGREIFPNELNTGDFLALMILMGEEMDALGAPSL
jgi:hypothetical protein